ncbi:hypothetical protein CK203_008714 [Vitis vinifera]|uniref:Uncharacterized protein n=1 Tax=Vitis vinifera TaxID=29760 RepID=A0A438KDU6_VITVI|nr:hypothetical protein CK203_008714 [Vitis vinifera]
MEASACLCCVTVFFEEDTYLAMISFGWVRSLGSGPSEVRQALDHRRSFSYDMERGVRAAYPGDSALPASDRTAPGQSGGLTFLSVPPLDACLATKTCWVAARTSSSSIEYFLARLNKSSIVCRRVLMFCLCRAEHKYCPTKASDRLAGNTLQQQCVVANIERHKLSIMHDMVEGVAGAHQRRREHVVQPFADGTSWWFAWEVSPILSYREVRVNVPHHGGDHGVTVRKHILHQGVTLGSGRAAQVVVVGALISQDLDILILVLALSLLLGLLNADDEEVLMLKPRCVVPRFLLLIFLSPRGELSVVVRLPTVFFRWLGAIQNYLPLPYQMNGFGKVWPSLLVTESVINFPHTTPMLRPRIPVVPPAKGVRTGCPDAPSDGFVSHGGGRAIITLRVAERDRGGGTWAMAGCL